MEGVGNLNTIEPIFAMNNDQDASCCIRKLSSTGKQGYSVWNDNYDKWIKNGLGGKSKFLYG